MFIDDRHRKRTLPRTSSKTSVLSNVTKPWTINSKTQSSSTDHIDNFRLQSMGTMEQMQNVMNGMANIMGNAKNKIKVQEFQKSMKTYTSEKERMQAMNEMIQDTMEMGEDEIDDSDVDKLILGMEDEVHRKKMAQAELQADEQEEF